MLGQAPINGEPLEDMAWLDYEKVANAATTLGPIGVQFKD